MNSGCVYGSAVSTWLKNCWTRPKSSTASIHTVRLSYFNNYHYFFFVRNEQGHNRPERPSVILYFDGRRAHEKKKKLLSNTHTMRRSCSNFGKIPSRGLGGDSVTDSWTGAGHMSGRMHGKNHVALERPYHEVKWCSKYGIFRRVV